MCNYSRKFKNVTYLLEFPVSRTKTPAPAIAGEGRGGKENTKCFPAERHRYGYRWQVFHAEPGWFKREREGGIL